MLYACMSVLMYVVCVTLCVAYMKHFSVFVVFIIIQVNFTEGQCFPHKPSRNLERCIQHVDFHEAFERCKAGKITCMANVR
jgi:hypothetical protein